MFAMIFTDILGAIEEAQYLADTEHKTFYLLDAGNKNILVTRHLGERRLETVNPRESKK